MIVDSDVQPYLDTFDLVPPIEWESLVSSTNRERRRAWTKSGGYWLGDQFETVIESDWVWDKLPIRSDNWVMVAPRSSR